MEEKISIIVPIYNVEKYLDTCINSICNQSYTNLEIILIDDGSPDNCSEICDNWKIKDDRIIVIHQKNGGLSNARNTGIDICTGKYIIFIDSDDYIDRNMVKKLYDNINKTKSDISICDYYLEKNKKISLNNYPEVIFCTTASDKFDYLFNEYSTVTTVAWNKIYKRQLFEKLRYPDGKIHEDEFVICELLEMADKISYMLEPLYYYVQRNNSIMKQFNLKRFDCVEALEKRIDFFEARKDFARAFYTKKHLLYKLIDLLTTAVSCNDCSKDFLKMQIRKLKNVAKELNNKKNINFKDKVKIKLILFSPMLYFCMNRFRVSIKGRFDI